MQNQHEQDFRQPVYRGFPSHESNAPGFLVSFDHNNLPINYIPFYPVPQNMSTMAPGPLASPQPATNLHYDTGAILSGDDQNMTYDMFNGVDTPMDSAMSTQGHSLMTSPRGPVSLAPSPGPSTRPPAPPAHPIGHDRPRHHNQVQESSGSQSGGPVLRCEWAQCPRGGGFKSQQSLLRHLKEQHVSPGKYKCHECGRSFTRAHKHRDHMQKHHRTTSNAVAN